MPSPKVYICIVDPRIDQGRLEAAAAAETDGEFDWWNINQSAKIDDKIIFYSVAPDQAFVATGVVASEIRRVTDETSQFYGQYCADIRAPCMLPRRVPLAEAEQQFPSWGFPRRPSKQELASEMVEPLLALLGATDLVKRLDTAQIAQPISGDKLYQERARAALPLLVRQAEAGTSILYSDLAAELGMPNPRNLNFVLGSIGQSLENLAAEWGEKIPPIQCLVVNKDTGLPGEGIGWFILKKDEFAAMPLRQRREIVQAELQRVFAYGRWREVLDALDLEPVDSDLAEIVAAARSFHGGGESEAHKKLKEYVANNPQIVGLSPGTKGEPECPLLSGDCLDVSFVRKSLLVAVEVKSAISPEPDIARGIFQCVKYLAVMEAILIANSQPPNARAVLVLEGKLPSKLVELKNKLGVEVIEGVTPR
jgi:hypothetical protein